MNLTCQVQTQVPNFYVSLTISTETAPLKVHNVTLNMDNQRVILLVLLDLSAAFHTVNLQVLLKRLESSFGISYLVGRSQRICFESCYSKEFDLSNGAPQGSCIGPLLFTIYASKLFEIVKLTSRTRTPTQMTPSFIFRLNRIVIPTRQKLWVLWRHVLKISGLGWQQT